MCILEGWIWQQFSEQVNGEQYCWQLDYLGHCCNQQVRSDRPELRQEQWQGKGGGESYSEMEAEPALTHCHMGCEKRWKKMGLSVVLAL